MEVGFLSFLQTCRWPIFKGHSQRTLHVERAYRRRRACLSPFEWPSRSLACAIGGNVPSGRQSTSVAAAAPATSGSGTSSVRRTETTSKGSPPPPSSSPSSLQHPTHSHPQQPQPRGSNPRFRLLPEDPNDRQLPEDNPSLDDIVLDEQYYREMGLTEEEVQEALWQLDATEVDPEGTNLSPGAIPIAPLSTDAAAAAAAVEPRSPLRSRALGTFSRGVDEHPGHRGQLQQPTHESINGKGVSEARDTYPEVEEEEIEQEEEEEEDCDETDGTHETKLFSPFSDDFGLGLSAGGTADDGDGDDNEVYGPEAVVVAGFRPEEHGVVRALLDSAGGHVVKVLPVTESMLYGTVDEAVHLAEQDWAAPRVPDGPRGGGWGSQRTVLFSGLGLPAQLTVLELLESSGFPAVCAATARGDQAGRRLGEVLAEAVATQRSQANRISRGGEEGEPWRAAAAATGRVTDGRGGLAPLEELIGHKARDRLRKVYDNDEDFDNGARSVYDEDDAGGGGGGGGSVVPTLNSVGREAAASAEAEWEAWQVARNAAAAADWGIEKDDGVGRVSDRDPDPDPDSDSDLAAVPNLTDMGVDLEQLREQVLRQLSEMDPETLDELLVDSPYGDAAGEALTQWRRVQEDDSGQDRPTAAVPTATGGAAAAAAGTGPTADEMGQLAERQRQRWQEAKESLETAAAAAGQLVVHAESSLLHTGSPSPPPPSTSPPPQQQQYQPAAPSIPFPGPVGTHGSRPAETIENATAAASAAASSAPAHYGASRTASNTSVAGPGQQSAPSPPPPPPQPPLQRPLRQGPAPPRLTPTSAPAPTLDDLFSLDRSPGPVVSELNDLLGLDDTSVVSELDDLFGKLTPATSDDADDVTGLPPSLTSPLPAATPLSSLPSKPAPNSESGSGFGPGEMVRLGNTLAFVASGSGGGGSAGGGGVLQQVQEAARSGTAPEAIQKMLNERYGVTSAPPPAGAGTEPTAAVSPVPPMSAATATAAAAATAESNTLPRRRRGSLFAGLKSGKSAITSSSAAAGTPPSPLPEDGMRLRPRRSYGPVPAPAPDPLMKPLLDLRPDIARAVQEKKVQFMDLSRLNDKQKRQFVEHQARQRLQQQAQQQELQQQQQQQALQQLRRQQQQQQQQREGSGLEGARGATAAAAAAAAQTWPGGYGQKHTLVYGQDHTGAESYDYVYDSEEDSKEYDTEDEGEQEEEQDDEDQEYGTVLDAEKLQLLVEASRQEGVSLEETLAQAVAMGVRLPEAVLLEVGVSPPSEAALARAREEYDRMFQAWAAEEGLAVGAAQRTSLTSDDTDTGTDTGGNDRHLTHRASAGEHYGEAVGSSQASTTWSLPDIPSSSTSSRPAGAPLPTSRRDASSSASSSGSRPWGAGLAAKRRGSPGPSS